MDHALTHVTVSLVVRSGTVSNVSVDTEPATNVLVRNQTNLKTPQRNVPAPGAAVTHFGLRVVAKAPDVVQTDLDRFKRRDAERMLRKIKNQPRPRFCFKGSQ
ncbi:hypothetical protein EVAR_3368_1 [Eumeta japonica]|uniref:Uncharacterized protein n=1 Tax=Eumeta variegata TaxID=151549 RepID=A0A4C1SS05_EUMVA|nr:hypothetical protein EVAR_3368_1 [Eumeta japonica]